MSTKRSRTRRCASPAEVFEAVHAKLFLKSVEETPPTDPAIYRTSYLMQLEHLLHRMGGYAIHLEEINDEVFEPHRDLYLEALGFCPSDAVRLVRRHTVWLNRELELARKEFLALRNARATMGLDLPFSVARRVHTVLEAAYRWKADDLAKATTHPIRQVAALLEAMARRFRHSTRVQVPL